MITHISSVYTEQQ